MDISFDKEIVDLGPLGPTAVYQVSGSEFQNACLQANSVESDNTGYRLHGGAYVAIRAIAKMSFLFEGKRVLELGTGSGIVGIAASKLAELASVALTDGNARALDIARMNAASVPYNTFINISRFRLTYFPAGRLIRMSLSIYFNCCGAFCPIRFRTSAILLI